MFDRGVRNTFLAFFLPAAVLFLGVVGYGYDTNRRSQQAIVEAGEAGTVALQVETIKSALDDIVSDLHILAALAETHDYLRHREAATLQELEAKLLTFARHKPRYDQLRILDWDGWEVMRVDHRNGRLTAVPPDQLQLKANRYYFSETFQLEPGQVYVSPLDLNVENDVIEQPHRPMIRFGMPVFGSDGYKRGIVVLNYLARFLIADLRRVGQGLLGEFLLLDPAGYWLVGPDPDQEWGFMDLDRREHTFANAFPEAWRQIVATEAGQFHSPQGLFTFITVFPRALSQPPALVDAVTVAAPDQYLWRIVSHVAPEVLRARTQPMPFPLLLILVGGGLGLLASASWMIAEANERRRRGEMSLRAALEETTVLYKEVDRLADLYATLSQINQAIIRIDARQDLLDAICRVTAQYAGFRLVWIGWLDPQTQQVQPVARAGLAKGYLDEVVVYADDRPEGCCVAGVSLREGRPCVFNDFRDDPRAAPWRDASRRHELGAAAAMPIRFQGEVRAAFAVYAATPGLFQTQEINLLEEAAADISFALDHLESERQRRDNAARLTSIFRAASVGIGLVRERVVLEANDTLCRMTGYSREELYGQSSRLFYLNDRDYEWVGQEKYRQIAEWGTGTVEVRWRRKDGRSLWVILSSTPLDVGDLTKGVTFTALDITERKQTEEQLAHLAYHDTLTDLPNRVLLTDRLRQAMAQSQRDRKKLAVCSLDLDAFKPINDAWGHAAGDRVLVEVAQRLRGCLRAGDTVARLGGDEFVLLLGDLSDVEECERALERVRAALDGPFAVADRPSVALGASLGVTLYPDDDADPDVLLRHTDQAMYAAKQAGGRCYRWFDADHDRRARTHRDLLDRVATGLAAGEFRLHYQPKVDMRGGAVIGAEALIRWQDPERGLIAPGGFMPAVETSDLAIAVDRWVLGEALRQMSVWVEQGLRLPVSVNVSGRHLQCSDFFAGLQAALAAHPTVPPEWLELEILETSALDDVAAISRLIADCRGLGVRFSLDDFGTGYSSLTYLKHLPVQVLKIDQSFVRDLLVDADARAIVEGVIGLSAAFRRQVIAEGVETAAHGRRLLELGCDFAQGYGIARPMPSEQIPDWIAGWTASGAWAESCE